MDKRHRIPLCSCVVDWPYFSTMEVRTPLILSTAVEFTTCQSYGHWAPHTWTRTWHLWIGQISFDWFLTVSNLLLSARQGKKPLQCPHGCHFQLVTNALSRKPTTKLISSQSANQEKIHLLALCLLPPFWSLFVLLRLHTLIDMVLLIFGPSFQRSLPRSNEIQMPRGKRCQRWYFVFQIIFGGIFTEKTKLHLHEDPLGDELSHSVKILCEYAYDT